jgi:hypothetical protein
MANEPRIISFDTDYMRNYSNKNISGAQRLIDEALSELRSASVNSNWNCPEREYINGKLREDIAKKLLNIRENALGGISSALTAGAAQLDEWESRGSRSAEDVSGRLQNGFGYSGTAWGSGDEKNLPVTQIPKWGLGDYLTQGARVITAGLGLMFGAFLGGLHGVSKGSLLGAISGVSNMDVVGGIFKGGVPGGVEGFFNGSSKGGKIALETFDKMFGTKEEIVQALSPDDLAARSGNVIGENEQNLVNSIVNWLLKLNLWK